MAPMTARDIATLLSYIIPALFVMALAMFLLALQQLRRGRRGPYWRLRRQASQRGGVLFLASVGLFVIASALAFYSGLAAVAFRGVDAFFRQQREGLVGVVVPTITPTLDDTLTPTITATATATASVMPTETALPTDTATLTATPTATLTSTPTPTLTLTPSLTWTPSPTVEIALNLTPPGAGIPARAGAAIEITAAGESVSSAGQPPEPRLSFPAGIKRVYLFIAYQRMRDGSAWSRVLYRNGEPVQGQAYLWSQGEAGQSYFFFGNEAGYPPGEYEARVYVGADEVSRFGFTIEDTGT